jgi:hypothetical protein
MAGLTMDAGALLAFERNDRRVVALLARVRHSIATSDPVDMRRLAPSANIIPV